MIIHFEGTVQVEDKKRCGECGQMTNENEGSLIDKAAEGIIKALSEDPRSIGIDYFYPGGEHIA